MVSFVAQCFLPRSLCPDGVGSASGYIFVVDNGGFEVRLDGTPVATLGRGCTFGWNFLMKQPQSSSVYPVVKSGLWGADGQKIQQMLTERIRERIRENRKLLDCVSFFKGLPPRQIELLSSAIVEESVRAGTKVVAKGEFSTALYFIRKGQLRVEENQKELGPGDYFGERALLHRAPRSATVVAETEAELLRLEAENLKSVVGPDLLVYLSRSLVLEALRSSQACGQFNLSQQSAIMKNMKMMEVTAGSCIDGARHSDFLLLAVIQGSVSDQANPEQPNVLPGQAFEVSHHQRHNSLPADTLSGPLPMTRANSDVARERLDLAAGAEGAKVALLTESGLEAALGTGGEEAQAISTNSASGGERFAQKHFVQGINIRADDCGELVSMLTPPAAAMNLKVDVATGRQEEMAAKLVADLGGHFEQQAAATPGALLKMEEARKVPGMNSGNDFVKVPLPAQETHVAGPMLLPPLPHSVQRPPKNPRYLWRLIPDRANLVISKGSMGHPFSCAAACRYVRRKGGCRDGADCLDCHECFWSKASTKDSASRNSDQAQAEEAVRARPVVVATKEDLTNDSDILGDSKVSTAGMVGFEAPELEMQQGMNPGSLGHPYSCGPACKYALKSRGCKDGDMCTRCHLCHWTRFSAKSLKLIEDRQPILVPATARDCARSKWRTHSMLDGPVCSKSRSGPELLGSFVKCEPITKSRESGAKELYVC
ncbi:pkaR [Symbiodinium sp. CCMP2592]|nr:pkaR [Symbiodinium sp. CCMP2592]